MICIPPIKGPFDPNPSDPEKTRRKNDCMKLRLVQTRRAAFSLLGWSVDRTSVDHGAQGKEVEKLFRLPDEGAVR